MYKLQFRKSVYKDLQKIPEKYRNRIWKKIEFLKTNPYPKNCKKLRGYKSTYRLRTGQYRIVYSVKKDVLIIEIIKIGHRKDIYKNLK